MWAICIISLLDLNYSHILFCELITKAKVVSVNKSENVSISVFAVNVNVISVNISVSATRNCCAELIVYLLYSRWSTTASVLLSDTWVQVTHVLHAHCVPEVFPSRGHPRTLLSGAIENLIFNKARIIYSLILRFTPHIHFRNCLESGC